MAESTEKTASSAEAEKGATEVLEQSAEVLEKSAALLEQLDGYGSLILDSVILLAGGLFVIFLLHTLASKFLYARWSHSRAMKVLFGALYVLVLVITILLTLKELGFNVSALGRLAILVILVGAVLVFFLLPFLPRLPFMLGHLVEINGVMGNVQAISSFHTTLRKFDGTIVFIPNALVMASRIMNFSDSPNRRVEINLAIDNDSDLEESMALVTRLMAEDERVLKDPAPDVFAMSATASGVTMLAVCWVTNENWLRTRSDIWLRLIQAFNEHEGATLSLQQQEVYLHDKRSS